MAEAVKRHAARYAQGAGSTLAALVVVVVVRIRCQDRELAAAQKKLFHRLELIQAETKGAMRAREEMRRAELAGRAWWKW